MRGFTLRGDSPYRQIGHHRGTRHIQLLSDFLLVQQEVRIPGCPPRPGDIIRALLMAMGRAMVLDSTKGTSRG